MSPLWSTDPHRVPLDGGGLALHLPGREPSALPPVLLVHGFRGCAAEWGPLAARLAAHRDVWAPELVTARGGGLPAVHALLDQVRALAGGGPIHVVGTSMGGFLVPSWQCAAGLPEDVVTLVAPALVHLQPAWRVPGVMRLLDRTALLDADERTWAAGLPSATIDDFFADSMAAPHAVPARWRQALLETARASVSDHVAAGRVAARQDVLRALLRTLRTRGAAARLVTGMGKPVQWLHGDADGRVPFGPSRQLALSLPRVTFEMLPGRGHMPHLECPDVVAGHLMSWVPTGAT
jgi:pimeloyl-ACP methyl ester carboxylesterase